MKPSHSSAEHRPLTARFRCQTEEETAQLARLLAEQSVPGLVITLNGTLGAGKTFFTRAFATALGIPDDAVTSPTYVIIQHYQAAGWTLHHFDLYRLRDLDEWDELGAEELLESEAISLIEWADRFPQVLPDDRLEIRIQVQGESAREFQLTAREKTAEEVLRRWSEKSGAVLE